MMKNSQLFSGLFGFFLSVSCVFAQQTTNENATVQIFPGDNLWDLTEMLQGNGANWRRLYDANKDILPAPTGPVGKEHVLLNERRVPQLRIPPEWEYRNALTPEGFDFGEEDDAQQVFSNLEEFLYRSDELIERSDQLGERSQQLMDELQAVQQAVAHLDQLEEEKIHPRIKMIFLIFLVLLAIILLAAIAYELISRILWASKARHIALDERAEAIRKHDHERLIAAMDKQLEADRVEVKISYDNSGRVTGYEAKGPGAQVPTNWYGPDAKALVTVHVPQGGGERAK